MQWGARRRKQCSGPIPPGWLGLIVPVLVGGLTACDPQIHVHGRVTSTQGPIRTAEVRVECPGLCAFGVVHDDHGNYSGHKMGGCPVNCSLRVRSAGYRDFVSPLARFCLKQSGGTCWEVAADVTLQAAPP
jgi:hypothetical protein